MKYDMAQCRRSQLLPGARLSFLQKGFGVSALTCKSEGIKILTPRTFRDFRVIGDPELQCLQIVLSDFTFS